MRTKLRVFRPDQALQEQIDAAVRILQNGGVVAIPTDTLYGLAACAFYEAAIQRIFRLKGRPSEMALPLLLADAEDVTRWAVGVPEVASKLADRFWPGGLTLVLRKVDAIPGLVSGGLDTIALRVPDHQVPRAIARELGVPITGTSANRSGRRSLTTAMAMRDEFGDELDLVVEGGDDPTGLASTVLDLTGERPRILRQGAVSRRDIEAVCGFEASV